MSQTPFVLFLKDCQNKGLRRDGESRQDFLQRMANDWHDMSEDEKAIYSKPLFKEEPIGGWSAGKKSKNPLAKYEQLQLVQRNDNRGEKALSRDLRAPYVYGN